jgi:hypothetical protein
MFLLDRSSVFGNDFLYRDFLCHNFLSRHCIYINTRFLVIVATALASMVFATALALVLMLMITATLAIATAMAGMEHFCLLFALLTDDAIYNICTCTSKSSTCNNPLNSLLHTYLSPFKMTTY